jgi:hypothetical protein
MRGLRSIVNWRTFLVGVAVGYVVAWGVHRAVMFQTTEGWWVEEVIPYLTPGWGRP